MGEKVRDIKFRAWNGKEMFNVDVLAISPCTWDCPDYGKRGVSLAYQPHIKVMQYTGLNDKNGKEIFEGDVYHQGDPRITYTVVWNDSGLIGKQNGSSSYAGLSAWQERIEVIGNIYENPELLEEGK